MKIKLIIIALVMLILGSLVTTGCNKSTTPPEEEPILIGINDDVTGFSAEAGRGQRDSAIMAIDEKNAAGGINGRRIEYLFRDNAGDPVKATTTAKEFVTREVDAFVGITSTTVGTPAIEILGEAQIPIFGTSCSSSLMMDAPDGHCYYFVSPMVTPYLADSFTWYALDKVGGKKIAIIISKVAWPELMRTQELEYLEKHPEYGAEVVIDISVDVNSQDLTNEVLQIKASGADLVLYSMYPVNLAAYYRAVQVTSWYPPPPMVGFWTLAQAVWNANPKELLFNTYAAALTCTERDDVQAWLKKFEAKFGYQPTEQALCQWDNMQTLFAAMEAVGTDGPAIREWIETKAKGRPTLTGNLGAKADYTVEHFHSCLRVEDLAWLYINEKGEQVWVK